MPVSILRNLYQMLIFFITLELKPLYRSFEKINSFQGLTAKARGFDFYIGSVSEQLRILKTGGGHGLQAITGNARKERGV